MLTCSQRVSCRSTSALLHATTLASPIPSSTSQLETCQPPPLQRPSACFSLSVPFDCDIKLGLLDYSSLDGSEARSKISRIGGGGSLLSFGTAPHTHGPDTLLSRLRYADRWSTRSTLTTANARAYVGYLVVFTIAMICGLYNLTVVITSPMPNTRLSDNSAIPLRTKLAYLAYLSHKSHISCDRVLRSRVACGI